MEPQTTSPQLDQCADCDEERPREEMILAQAGFEDRICRDCAAERDALARIRPQPAPDLAQMVARMVGAY